MLDPGFVGAALQHIDVPALLKPVPQAFPESQGGGQLNNPVRILKERSIAGFAGKLSSSSSGSRFPSAAAALQEALKGKRLGA